jgi:histidinol phosphatase-like PHP family hydrolase
MILKRSGYPVDIDAIVDSAARHGVALEINSQAYRLDINDAHADWPPARRRHRDLER